MAAHGAGGERGPVALGRGHDGVDSELRDQAGDDPVMGRLLRERLRRHPAPPHLRAAVARMMEPEPRARRWRTWLTPALSAAATALVAALLVAPRLPGPTGLDRLQLLAHAAVAEQAHSMARRDLRPDLAPARLTRAMEESGIPLTWVFVGDEDLAFVDARATLVRGHRAMALAYQTADGRAVTYVVLRGVAVALPERGRVQIDRYRPLLRQVDGFGLIIWQQEGLFCALVSDLAPGDDVARLKRHFLKVRAATEPYAEW